jgi:hypothetical protein
MRKFIKPTLYAVVIGTFVVSLTGCASISPKVLIDGVLGHYPHYDSNEYDRAVRIESWAKQLKNNQAFIVSLIEDINELKLYTSGRPYNERIDRQVELLSKVTQELLQREQSHNAITSAYYQAKCDTIVKLADTLRLTIGKERL